MTKLASLCLALAASLPAAAVEFDQGVDAAAAVRAAREARPMAAAADSPARSSLSVPPARRTELVLRSSEWHARKADMRRALNAFYDNVTWKEGRYDEWKKTVLKIWGLARQIEEVDAVVAGRLKDRVAASGAAPGEIARRDAALDTMVEFRNFVVYGNFLPRIIDEASRDDQGLYNGRTLAGPTWGIAMTYDEGEAIGDDLLALTGFTKAEYKAEYDAATAEYQSAHPEPR